MKYQCGVFYKDDSDGLIFYIVKIYDNFKILLLMNNNRFGNERIYPRQKPTEFNSRRNAMRHLKKLNYVKNK